MEILKKKIWLINQYAMPPKLESRLRTIKFAHYLSEIGYDVTIFASSVMHNMDINLITDNAKYMEKTYDDLHFVHIKTKQYKKNGFARIIGLLQFPIRFCLIAKNFNKPNIIIQTATVPFGNIIYFFAKKINAKYIVEILDLWPQSLVDLGMLSKRNPILMVWYYLEKWLYKKADTIVFSMEGGKEYICDNKWDLGHGGPIDLNKVYYINNGVDLNDFNRYKQEYIVKDLDLQDESIKKIIYLGSIRLANNLQKLIDTAVFLKEQKDIKILLYGDGDDRQFLEKYCLENNLDNVIFKEKWIDPKYVPYVLSKARVNVLNYMPGNFGKYGGSQSKLFQYLAAGKPICSNLNMMYDIINKYDVGISREYTSATEYAEVLSDLVNLNDEKYQALSQRAQEAAKNFDYEFLTKRMAKLVE
ncbi:MAG: glycosyltransferase family 4 protein [Bacteroidales bacterium]